VIARNTASGLQASAAALLVLRPLPSTTVSPAARGVKTVRDQNHRPRGKVASQEDATLRNLKSTFRNFARCCAVLQ